MEIEHQNGYQILYERVNPIILQDIKNKTAVDLVDNCEFCLRSRSETGGNGVIWTDSYHTDNKICKTCNIFVEQLPTVLGYERGSIGYKFSSFKGGYLAIPKDINRPVEIWVGGKYLDRVVSDGAVKVVAITGNLAKYELCESIGDYSVVTEISIRREMFLRYIKESSGNMLHVSTEAGLVSINKKEYQALKKAFVKEDLPPKEFLNVITMINSIKQGNISITHKTSQAVLSGLSKETLIAIKNIENPTSLLYMMAALRAGITNKVKK